MLITPINNKFQNLKTQNNRSHSSVQKTDSLVFKSAHVLNRTDSLTQEQLHFIKAKISELNTTELKPIGEGKFGTVFKFSGYPGTNTDIVIKQQRLWSNGEFYDDFSKEAQNLERIPETLTSTPRFIARLKSGDKHYLVETFVKGDEIDSRPMTQNDLKGVLKDFLELDKKGMYHDDLWNPNLLIDDKGIKIVDFGSVKETSLKKRPKYFPQFYLPSNAFDFEKRKLCWMWGEFKTPEGRKKLREYLTIKSEYHKNRANHLVSGSAKEFERLEAQFLQKPSRQVLGIEASKIRIAFYHKQSEVGFSPLENKINSIKEAIRLRSKAAIAMRKTTNKDYKSYLEYQKKFANHWVSTIFKEIIGAVR